jgi:hypothetical protein
MSPTLLRIIFWSAPHLYRFARYVERIIGDDS